MRLLLRNRVIVLVFGLFIFVSIVHFLPLFIAHSSAPRHHQRINGASYFMLFQMADEANQREIDHQLDRHFKDGAVEEEESQKSFISRWWNFGFGGGKDEDDDQQKSDEPPIDFEKVFAERKRHAYKTCEALNQTKFKKFKNHPKAPYSIMAYKFLFVDDKHKIVFCNVPKVASTNWKKLLLVLSGSPESTFKTPDDVSDELINTDAYQLKNWTNFKPLALYHGESAFSRLKNYTKIIWVRDPFKRLVSAWRSKFFSPNPYYNRVGRFIIAKFRPNATKAEQERGYPVSFEEFMSYIRLRGQEKKFDVHWNLVTDFCMFCEIEYDYIGHYETLLPEARYLLTKLAGREGAEIRFPTKNKIQAASYMREANYTELLYSLPEQLANETLHVFDDDFRIFGYRKPPGFEDDDGDTGFMEGEEDTM